MKPIYLDHNSTTQVAPAVREAMLPFLPTATPQAPTKPGRRRGTRWSVPGPRSPCCWAASLRK